MKNIIVVVPTEKESAFIVDRGIRVCKCGVGMAECSATVARLIVEGRPDLMILAGTAGTYTEDIETGETVIVASETIADLGRWSGLAADCCGVCGEGTFTPLFQKTYYASVVPKGFKAVRSNTVNTAGGIIAEPVEAEVENMEGAAFFAMCERFGVPAMEVRTVSNTVGQCIRGKNMEIATSRLALDLQKIIRTVVKE